MNNSIKKGVAVAVILLFIGLAFAPSINANISKASVDSELVEITTEVCGLNGGKHTVSLTREDAEEVDALFNSISERLNATESREEAEEIFNEAVVELDKYGLLGSLSVEQAQKLVIGDYQNQMVRRKKDGLHGRYQSNLNKKENFDCLIIGSSTETRFLHETPLFDSLMELLLYYFGYLFIILLYPLYEIRHLLPFGVGRLAFGFGSYL